MADGRTAPAQSGPAAVKVVIAGGFGAGKTTLVSAVSDIEAITTESRFTAASESVDDLALVPHKRATTVAMDFGRVDLDHDLSMYLFGTPGQERFWFMWTALIRGAMGAVVLVDTRRLAACFSAVDFFEANELPYVVVVNPFDGAQPHTEDELRDALAIGAGVPLLFCDARNRAGVKQVLIGLLEYLISQRDGRRAAAAVTAPLNPRRNL